MIINDSVKINEKNYRSLRPDESWKTMHGSHIIVNRDGDITGGYDPKSGGVVNITDDFIKKNIPVSNEVMKNLKYNKSTGKYEGSVSEDDADKLENKLRQDGFEEKDEPSNDNSIFSKIINGITFIIELGLKVVDGTVNVAINTIK